MPKFTVLFLVACFSCFGQQFMPEPLPQVEYIGSLPGVKVDVHNVDEKGVPEKPSNNFITGSAPRAHMIVLQHVDPKPSEASAELPESPEVFYLQDNIWNNMEKKLERFLGGHEPPLGALLEIVKGVARHNKIKVPIWKLDGIILDTKMPKGYRLEDPTVYLKDNFRQQ